MATTFLKWLQLLVSLGVLLLFWLIYPGALLLFAGIGGLCYVVASAAAARDRPAGVWFAAALSVLAFGFSAWGVYRYLDNGFDYLAGNFAGRAGIYWPAYLFLLVAVGSFVVIVLHGVAWRWVLEPRSHGGTP